jgi:hypothetical protein
MAFHRCASCVLLRRSSSDPSAWSLCTAHPSHATRNTHMTHDARHATHDIHDTHGTQPAGEQFGMGRNVRGASAGPEDGSPVALAVALYSAYEEEVLLVGP